MLVEGDSRTEMHRCIGDPEFINGNFYNIGDLPERVMVIYDQAQWVVLGGGSAEIDGEIQEFVTIGRGGYWSLKTIISAETPVELFSF